MVVYYGLEMVLGDCHGIGALMGLEEKDGVFYEGFVWEVFEYDGSLL